MSSLFEIIVFEGQGIYDIEEAPTEEEAVRIFIKLCRLYVNPWIVPQGEASLTETKKTVIYADHCGSDKPCIVILVGPNTLEMIAAITDDIDKFYVTKCAYCSEDIILGNVFCSSCADK